MIGVKYPMLGQKPKDRDLAIGNLEFLDVLMTGLTILRQAAFRLCHIPSLYQGSFVEEGEVIPEAMLAFIGAQIDLAGYGEQEATHSSERCTCMSLMRNSCDKIGCLRPFR